MIERSDGDAGTEPGQTEDRPPRTAEHCRLCAGSGRIVLLSGMFADMRIRSSFRTEECHFCRGTGESARTWPEWEEEQARLRTAMRAARANTQLSAPGAMPDGRENPQRGEAPGRRNGVGPERGT